MKSKLSVLLLICSVNWIVYCSHFRGAVFMWAPGNDGKYITITFRISWKISRVRYDPDTVADGGLIGSSSDSMSCISGCYGTVGSLRFRCTDFGYGEYSSGTNSVNYTARNKQFVFGFSGNAWRGLLKGGGSWSFRTSVDLSVRTDTGKINTSPTVFMPPVLKLQTRCSYIIPLPVADVDRDIIKCRWASGNECDSVCQTFPGSLLNTSTCTISYTAGTSIGYYAVALQIEDFSNTTSTMPLSSIPLQFLVYIYSGTGCTDVPWFVLPTPNSNARFIIDAGDTVNVTIKAQGPKTFSRLIAMSAVPVTRTTEVTSKDTTWSYITITVIYKPTSADAGKDHSLCFYAKDIIGVTSNTRCITIHVEGTDNDNCDPYRCHNGATCTDGISGFDCICPDGYSGDTCSSDINECSNQTDNCDVNAECTNTFGSFTCACNQGFSGNGPICLDTDECADGSNDCDLNAGCTNTIGSFTCNCLEGFTGNGNLCADINECDSSPCINGGKCIDKVNGYVCRCVAGYEGANCERDIDECLSLPCKNKANCSHAINNYTCTCLTGYAGIICEIEIDECASNPCQNNAHCTDIINGYVCTCEDEYEGINCETDTNNLLSDKPSRYTVIVGAVLGFLIIVLGVYATYSTFVRWRLGAVKVKSSTIKENQETTEEDDTGHVNETYMNMVEMCGTHVPDNHPARRKDIGTADEEEDYSNIAEYSREDSKVYETIY